jgi:hypothetical protein
MTPLVDALEAEIGESFRFRDEVQRLLVERALELQRKLTAEYNAFLAKLERSE